MKKKHTYIGKKNSQELVKRVLVEVVLYMMKEKHKMHVWWLPQCHPVCRSSIAAMRLGLLSIMMQRFCRFSVMCLFKYDRKNWYTALVFLFMSANAMGTTFFGIKVVSHVSMLRCCITPCHCHVSRYVDYDNKINFWTILYNDFKIQMD